MKYEDRKVINAKIMEALAEIVSSGQIDMHNLDDNVSDGIRRLHAALGSDTDDYVDYASAAEILYNNGEKWKKIALLCSEVMMAHKPTIYDYQFCGKILVAEGHYRSAIELLEKAIEEHEADLEINDLLSNVYANLAYACLKLEDKESAIEYATKVIGSTLKDHMRSGKLFETFDYCSKENPDATLAQKVLIQANGTIFNSSHSQACLIISPISRIVTVLFASP